MEENINQTSANINPQDLNSTQNQTPQSPTPPMPRSSNVNYLKTISIGMSIVSFCIGIAVIGYFLVTSKNTTTQTACTLEAKVCPNGTSVGRTGPNCSFAPCLTATPTPQNLSSDNELVTTDYYSFILPRKEMYYKDGNVLIRGSLGAPLFATLDIESSDANGRTSYVNNGMATVFSNAANAKIGDEIQTCNQPYKSMCTFIKSDDIKGQNTTFTHLYNDNPFEIESGARLELYLAKYGNKYFQLAYYYDRKTLRNGELTKSDVYQILSTFKFVDRSPNDTSDWKTYINPRFTIKYPPYFYIAPNLTRMGADYIGDSQTSTNNHIAGIQLQKSQLVITLLSVVENSTDPQEIANRISGGSTSNVPFSTIDIAGNQTIKTINNNVENYGISKNGSLAWISVQPLNSDKISIVQLILSTFKFTN